MAMLFGVPQEYMEQKRPVDPQVDTRNLLAALGGAYQAPNTAFFGLSPSEAAKSARQVDDTLARMAAQLQAAQSAGIQQERQRFQDANAAHQLYLADRDQRQQEALRALQMAQMRQGMGQAAATHALNIAKAKAELEWLQQAQKQMVETPLGKMSLFAASKLPSRALNGGHQSATEAKTARNIAAWKRLEVESDGNSHPDDNRQKARKELSDWRKDPMNMGATAAQIADMERQIADAYNFRGDKGLEYFRTGQLPAEGGTVVAPAQAPAQAPVDNSAAVLETLKKVMADPNFANLSFENKKRK